MRDISHKSNSNLFTLNGETQASLRSMKEELTLSRMAIVRAAERGIQNEIARVSVSQAMSENVMSEYGTEDKPVVEDYNGQAAA